MRVLEFEGKNPKYRILRDTAEPVTRIGKDGNEEIVCYSYQIEACRDFGDVKEDDKGGRVTGFHNLSHEGLCWIEPGSSVVEGASVRDNAHIGRHTHISGFVSVSEEASISGTEDKPSLLSGRVVVEQQSIVRSSILNGNAVISNNARVEESEISAGAVVKDFAWVVRSNLYYNAVASGHALVEDSVMQGCSSVRDHATLRNSMTREDAVLRGNVSLIDGVTLTGKSDLSGKYEIVGSLRLADAHFTTKGDFIIIQDGRIEDGALVLLDLVKGRWYLGDRCVISGWNDKLFIDATNYHTESVARKWYTKAFRPLYYKVLPSGERTLWEKIKMLFDK